MYTWLPITTTDDLLQLEGLIPSEYQPKRVAQKLSSDISDAVKSILIEHNYIDKDYRSTYYSFYAKKGRRYRANCVRLHFFDETVQYEKETLRLMSEEGSRLDDHYYGYMVLRPTWIATIGRSVVSPDVRKGANGLIIASTHKVHLLGYELRVDGFPSMDQHNDISVCAHVACWSILRHYSERYSGHRDYLTYDITLMAQQFNPGGLVPSRGLTVSHAERVFQEAGTFPVMVARKQGATSGTAADPAFYRQLLAYVDSGFPLFGAMRGHSHAIAIAGYEWATSAATPSPGVRYAWDKLGSLVVVDDNHLPYLSVPLSGCTHPAYCATDIDSFIVALPEKIFYPADAVDRLAPTLYKLDALVSLPPEEKTIIRYFILTGSALRCFMRERESEFDHKLLQTVMGLPFAQFVWVVEFSTEEEWAVGQISARAIIDATASLREYLPLWLFHNRKKALVIDRRNGLDISDVRTLDLSGMETTALTRCDKNLRRTRIKTHKHKSQEPPHVGFSNGL